MALSNQPYLPLYVQDFLTDEKLNECSAEAVGVYIKIMCLMHKSKTYGKILLKQKYQQNDKQILDFATFFARLLPYRLDEILRGLVELLEEDVLQIEGKYLMQKRMIKDNNISEIRSKSGKKGGISTSKSIPKKQQNFALAKIVANAENEIEYDNAIKTVIDYLNKKASTDFKTKTKNTRTLIIARLKDGYLIEQFETVIDKKTKEWLSDPNMVKYLRPETLFGNKFEGYLNQPEVMPGTQTNKPSATESALNRAENRLNRYSA